MATHLFLTQGKCLLGAAALAAVSLVGRQAAAQYCVGSELWSAPSWQTVGYHPGAARLAACTPTVLYALDGDKNLWKTTDQGSAWTYVTTPGSAASIACNTADPTGTGLVVMNNDKSLYSQDVVNGAWAGWLNFAQYAYEAQVIGGGPNLVTAINYDGSIWTSKPVSGIGGGAYTGGLPFVGHGVPSFAGVTATNASRMTGGPRQFFILQDDGLLWQADTANSWEFYLMSSQIVNVIDVTVDAETSTLFELDNEGTIYKATLAEIATYSSPVACIDSIF